MNLYDPGTPKFMCLKWYNNESYESVLKPLQNCKLVVIATTPKWKTVANWGPSADALVLAPVHLAQINQLSENLHLLRNLQDDKLMKIPAYGSGSRFASIQQAEEKEKT